MVFRHSGQIAVAGPQIAAFGAVGAVEPVIQQGCADQLVILGFTDAVDLQQHLEVIAIAVLLCLQDRLILLRQRNARILGPFSDNGLLNHLRLRLLGHIIGGGIALPQLRGQICNAVIAQGLGRIGNHIQVLLCRHRFAVHGHYRLGSLQTAGLLDQRLIAAQFLCHDHACAEQQRQRHTHQKADDQIECFFFHVLSSLKI